MSWVRFQNGRVTTWYSSLSAPLNAELVPSEPVVFSPGYFTVGSTKDEVLAVQGSPRRFTDTKWEYGLSWVQFQNGRVTTWYSSLSAPLNAELVPSEPVVFSPSYFTVGSTKDEVLAVQGSPRRFTDTKWEYGLSWVRFQNGRVTTWYASLSAPLKAELEP